MTNRSLKPLLVFRDLMRELRGLVDDGAAPAEVLGAVLDRTGYLAELRASEDPQDEGARREPGRAARRRRRLRGDRPGGLAGGLPGAGLAGRGQRPDPRRGRGRRRGGGGAQGEPGRRHAHDPAHRQGPGVPRRLPHGHGGRHVPAHALAARRHRARRGAPARLRGHHPRAGAAVHHAVVGARRLRHGQRVPGEPVPAGDPRGAVGLAAARVVDGGDPLRAAAAGAAGTAPAATAPAGAARARAPGRAGPRAGRGPRAPARRRRRRAAGRPTRSRRRRRRAPRAGSAGSTSRRTSRAWRSATASRTTRTGSAPSWTSRPTPWSRSTSAPTAPSASR